ncbi:type II secretion system F family protein [Nocardioides panacisoli]|uniref:type II secretion system F family protein n=1 Tax=Nocardioides panacisoli TaxID=627624 RepID=UPI001C62B29D|nr:type II secretion system F family protein [Nocardioides panacisoli]QYJ03129.1 type II secretion system F family protein [Nocardioides panacisoli]
MVAVAVVAAGLAVLLAAPGAARPPSATAGRRPEAVDHDAHDLGPIRRWRWGWALAAGLGAAAFVGGGPGLLAGAVAGGAVAHVAGRVEPRGARRHREAVRHDLPHVVALVGSALGSGADPAAAIWLVSRSLPGPAAEELAAVAARLEFGADPAQVWGDLAADPALGPLGATLLRAHRTGTSVVAATDRLADDLADAARGEVEDRARAVGVRAAVPLGVCLLPAFLLLGIVPLVAALLGDLQIW